MRILQRETCVCRKNVKYMGLKKGLLVPICSGPPKYVAVVDWHIRSSCAVVREAEINSKQGAEERPIGAFICMKYGDGTCDRSKT